MTNSGAHRDCARQQGRGKAEVFQAEYRLRLAGFAVQENLLGRQVEGPFPGELSDILLYSFDGRFRLAEMDRRTRATYDDESSVWIPKPGVAMVARGRERQTFDPLIAPPTDGDGWSVESLRPVTYEGRTAHLIRQRRANPTGSTPTEVPPEGTWPTGESVEIIIDDALGIGLSLDCFDHGSRISRQLLHSISGATPQSTTTFSGLR